MLEMEAFARGLDFNEDTGDCPVAEIISRDQGVRSILLSRAPGHKFKGFICLSLSVLVVLVVVVFCLGVDVGEEEPWNSAGSGTLTLQGIESRRDRLFSLVSQWKITSLADLEKSHTPAFRAFEWLLYSSGDLDEDALRTRFSLATLYFATQTPDGGSEWLQDMHWLSTYPVCLWHGVECVDEIDKTFESVKALNLSSNQLSGTIPHEIGLLGPNFELLDISKNNLFGTIPTSLSHLDGLGEFEGSSLLCSPLLPVLSHQLPKYNYIWDPTTLHLLSLHKSETSST